MGYSTFQVLQGLMGRAGFIGCDLQQGSRIPATGKLDTSGWVPFRGVSTRQHADHP